MSLFSCDVSYFESIIASNFLKERILVSNLKYSSFDAVYTDKD